MATGSRMKFVANYLVIQRFSRRFTFDHIFWSTSFLRCSMTHFLVGLSKKPADKKEIVMSTIIRSVLVAVALFGTVSAASAAPRQVDSPYHYDNPSEFNPATFFNDPRGRL